MILRNQFNSSQIDTPTIFTCHRRLIRVTTAIFPMILSLFLALFLPCAVLSLVFLVYVFVLLCYYTANDETTEFQSSPEKPVVGKGLSVSELEKLPRLTGKDLVLGKECPVCLDEIDSDEPVRLIPSCNHGFHRQCGDTWLSQNSVCPVCRRNLSPQLFDSLETTVS